MKRRTFSAALTAVSVIGMKSALSQEGTPVTIVVPYQAGGIADIVARLLAKSMATTLARPVIVDNKPGASALIGTKFVQKAKPDGNTLLLNAQNFMMSPGTLKGADYDPLLDFEAVAKLTTSPYLLMVHKDVPAKNVKEFFEWAKAQPGGVFCAAAGTGGSAAVINNAIERSTGVKINLVQYKGNADIVTALIGGQVHMTMTPSSAIFDAAAQSGQIRLIAVTTKDRSTFYPDLPTLRSVFPSLPGDEQWLALFAPRGTPKDVVQHLSLAASKALADPEIREALTKNNFQVSYLGAAEFLAYLKKARKDWEELVATSGVVFDK